MPDKLKILHMVGSPDDPFYFDVSCFYASGFKKPDNYDFYYAVVHIGGLWSFHSEMSYPRTFDDTVERVTIDKAISKILEIKPDASVHHMLCRRGFTAYRGLVEVLDIPLVGSPAECGFIAMNKAIARSICIANGVRMAEGFIVHQGDDITLLMDKISFPCVVKPAQSEDSMGVTLVKEKNELDEALKKAYEYDQVLLIERFIPGREIRVTVIRDPSGHLVLLPPWQYEDVPPNGIREFSQKLEVSENGKLVGKSSNPVYLDKEKESALINRLQEISFKAFNAIGLKDSVVIDYRVDENGLPWLLEINMTCSFGERSAVGAMVAEAGISQVDFFDQMINSAIKRHKAKLNNNRVTNGHCNGHQ